MPNINLLPQELAPNRKVRVYIKQFTKILVVWFVLLVIGSGVAFAYIFNLKSQIKKSEDNQTQLKTSIKALQETEQKLILIKDRLEKISAILKQENGWIEMDTLNSIIGSLPNGVSFDYASVSPGELEIGVTSLDSQIMSSYLDVLDRQADYKDITLDSLEFRKTKGYEIKITMKR